MTTINKNYKTPRIISLLVYLLFFFNNETLSNNLCQSVNQPVKYVCLALIIYLAYKFINNELIFDVKILFIYLAFLLFVAIAFLMDTGFTNAYMIMIMSISCALVVVEYIDLKDFFELYVRFMEFISMTSLLFTYVLKPFLPSMPFLFPKVVNSAGIVFYNARLCYVNVESDYYRNYGIFREPAVFAVFLCLALMIQLMTNGREERGFIRRNIVFLITLITTFSTTGYLAFLMLLLLFMGDYRAKYKATKKIVYILFFIAAIIFAVVLSIGTIDNPFDKFFNKTSSYQYRTESILSGLELILTKPFGYGIQMGLAAMQSNYELKNFFNTSTWISIAVFLGLPFCLLSVVGFSCFCKRHLKNILLFLPIVLLLSASQLIYNPIFYIIIFYGFTNIKVTGGKEK